jgi:hypothetical protein
MPSQKKRPVTLAAQDREELVRVTTTGVRRASMIMRARVLLALDTSVGEVAPKEVIAARLASPARRCGWLPGVSPRPVVMFTPRSRGRSVTCRRCPSPVTGEVEARLIAMACSQPPEGYARWSLRLLEKHVALAGDIPDLDHSTIGRVLKKRTASSSEEVLDHPTTSERRVRGPDGGRAGRLCPAL